MSKRKQIPAAGTQFHPINPSSLFLDKLLFESVKSKDQHLPSSKSNWSCVALSGQICLSVQLGLDGSLYKKLTVYNKQLPESIVGTRTGTGRAGFDRLYEET